MTKSEELRDIVSNFDEFQIRNGSLLFGSKDVVLQWNKIDDDWEEDELFDEDYCQ